MQKLYEPKNGILTVKYQPESGIALENPPRFSWLPANDENGPYFLELSQSPSFEREVIAYTGIPVNFFSPNKCLLSGTWYWKYGISNKNDYSYSEVRSFIIKDDTPKTPQPLRSGIECILRGNADFSVDQSISRKVNEKSSSLADEGRLKGTAAAHPRLWLTSKGVADFKKELKKNTSYCTFDKFYKCAVQPLLEKPFISEPKPYPDNKRVIALWRQSYQDCQTAFNYIRFLSIAGVMLENKDIIEKAVSATLSIAAWKLHGATGRDYNDESAFRVAGALAWGYDWLYAYFTDEQRETVREVLYVRTAEVVQHALVSSKIHYSLYDSHAVRSLSSVLMPCSIALLHEKAEAEEWLEYTVDYLNVLYTPWGGADGGWSEGGMYWTTGMAYLIEALNLLKNYTGINIFVRPFFQHTADFPLYCFAHDTSCASFCDQSNLGDKPILKTGFNARELAGVTRNGIHQWYFEQIAKRESYDDTRFFNTGWWNFYYDDMIYHSNYNSVKALEPKGGRCVKWFKDIGWVAIHSNMQNEDEHIAFIMKSSQYGSVSHSHADQNGFVLHAFGEPLLIESGYYIGFNSSMHRNWRRQTKSTNNLLIGGEGQYAGMDKTKQLAATGCITEVEETASYVKISCNSTAAYLPNVPSLERCTRDVYFVNDSYFVVVDTVRLTENQPISYLLHSLSEIVFDGHRAVINGKKACLTATAVFSSSGISGGAVNNSFEGVDLNELDGLDNQWHFSLNTNSAKNHVLVTCISAHKSDNYDVVETIKDDQGHDVYFYFTQRGKTFSLCVDGNSRY